MQTFTENTLNMIAVPKYRGLIVREGGYAVRRIKTYDDIIASYRLRHDVFCEELGWVPAQKSMLEIDRYDEGAIYFGVFSESGKLMACIRLILSAHDFMIESDFSQLVDTGYDIRKQSDTAEASRVCVAPEARSLNIIRDNESYPVSMLLFKGVYLWCMENDIRYLYTVVETSMLRFLRAKGFPCKLIGRPQTMIDGTHAAAVLMDWRLFETVNSASRPHQFQWFTQT